MKRAVLTLLAVAALSARITAESAAFDPTGKTYYTAVNIWCETLDSISSMNYHKGAILPAGTKVKIVTYDAGKKTIIFTKEITGVSYTLVLDQKHSRLTLGEYFERHFQQDNPLAPGGRFSSFTKFEQENIKAGTLATGMSKPAAIMAYGYPPSHRTPNLDEDVWTYWNNHWFSFKVVFRDGKVLDPGRAGP